MCIVMHYNACDKVLCIVIFSDLHCYTKIQNYLCVCLCVVVLYILQDPGCVPWCDVQAARSLDAARIAAGPKRGVFREAGAQCGRSCRQPGGGGGGPGAGRLERETAPRTPGPGENYSQTHGHGDQYVFLNRVFNNVLLCCGAEADRGGEHAGPVSAAVLAADRDASFLHSHPSG